MTVTLALSIGIAFQAKATTIYTITGTAYQKSGIDGNGYYRVLKANGYPNGGGRKVEYYVQEASNIPPDGVYKGSYTSDGASYSVYLTNMGTLGSSEKHEIVK